MLRHVPEIISPDLMKILMEMGHGDEIVLADRNFPATSKAKRLIRYDTIGICELLDVIIKLFPLDEAVGYNSIFMAVPESLQLLPPIWEKYIKILKKAEDLYFEPLKLDKPEFYSRSEAAFAVIITGEKERFANIILRKGILKANEHY